jgi:hypothetical protein
LLHHNRDAIRAVRRITWIEMLPSLNKLCVNWKLDRFYLLAQCS